jgi:hypothetical protein
MMRPHKKGYIKFSIFIDFPLVTKGKYLMYQYLMAKKESFPAVSFGFPGWIPVAKTPQKARSMFTDDPPGKINVTLVD